MKEGLDFTNMAVDEKVFKEQQTEYEQPQTIGEKIYAYLSSDYKEQRDYEHDRLQKRDKTVY